MAGAGAQETACAPVLLVAKVAPMILRRATVGVVGSVVLLACTPAPVPPPPQSVVPPPPTATAPVVVEPDLSPVSEPGNVVGFGVLRNPSQDLDALRTLFAGSPAQGALETAIQKLGDKGFAALKLDSHVDFVLALDPRLTDNEEPDFEAVVSFPLKSVDEVKRLKSIVEVKPGIFSLGEGDSPLGKVCFAARSVGDAPIRLVCGQKRRDLEDLLPWVTRGLPLQQLPTTDAHFELRMRPIQKLYHDRIQQMAPVLPSLGSAYLSHEWDINSPQLSDLLSSLVSEGVSLGQDLTSLNLDASLSPQEAKATGSILFHDTSSWTARAITGHNDRVGPPPALFWRLPAESDLGFFGRGADLGLQHSFIKGLSQVMDVLLDQLHLSTADHTKWHDVFAGLPTADTVQVSARGHVTPKKKGPPSMQDWLSGVIGWHLSGVETSPDGMEKWLKSLQMAVASPSLQKLIKTSLGKNAPFEPPMARIGAAPGGLPPGSQMLELSLAVDASLLDFVLDPLSSVAHLPSGKKKVGPPKKETLAIRIIVMPEGKDHYWLAIGVEAAQLKDLLLEVKAGSKAPSLDSRADLAPLRSSSLTMGGYMTLEGALANSSSSLGGGLSALLGKSVHPERVLESLPNKGKSPIFILGTPITGGPDRGDALAFDAPKEALADLMALLGKAILSK